MSELLKGDCITREKGGERNFEKSYHLRLMGHEELAKEKQSKLRRNIYDVIETNRRKSFQKFHCKCSRIKVF